MLLTMTKRAPRPWNSPRLRMSFSCSWITVLLQKGPCRCQAVTHRENVSEVLQEAVLAEPRSTELVGIGVPE